MIKPSFHSILTSIQGNRITVTHNLYGVGPPTKSSVTVPAQFKNNLEVMIDISFEVVNLFVEFSQRPFILPEGGTLIFLVIIFNY